MSRPVAILVLLGAALSASAQPKAPPVTVDDRLTNLEARVSALESVMRSAGGSPVTAWVAPPSSSATRTALPYSATRLPYYPSPLPPLPPSGDDFGSFGYGTPAARVSYAIPGTYFATPFYSVPVYGGFGGSGECANGSCGSASTTARRGLFGFRR